MAHGRPWYKRSGGDVVMAVMHFPDNDYRWTYSSIIDLLNDRDRPLADDAAFICGFARITKQKWAKVRAYLLDGGYLALTEDGRITNPRFEREAAEREEQHRRSVEGGREGGKRSAARRAGQAEMDLGEPESGRNLEETAHVSHNKHGNFSEGSSEVLEDGSPENNTLAEPPPQATRARKEARGESPEVESSPASNPTKVGVDDVDDVFAGDLLAITNRVAQAGAVSLHKSHIRVEAMDLVKGWLARGMNPETLIIPTVTQARTRSRHETFGSLNFYAPYVEAAHAKGGGSTPEQEAHWTPERKREARISSIALYRRMGRTTEADDMERTLDKDFPPTPPKGTK